MHELSIAQSIIDIVDETLNGENAKLLEISVEIGELVAVVPESLEFCYNVITENTKYAGSKLEIIILPLKSKCKNCKKEFQIEKFTFICPYCESNELDVLQGQELKIRHLEVE
jgi:hydrogenase nickel incorporation protein HypA/HybF